MITTYEANVHWMSWLKNQPGTMWLEMKDNRLVIKHETKDDCVISSASDTPQYSADQTNTKSSGCAILVNSAERLGENPCQPPEECEVFIPF